MIAPQSFQPDLAGVMRAKHHQITAAGADDIVSVNGIETEAIRIVNGEGIGIEIVTANVSVVRTRTVREGIATANASIGKTEIGSETEEIVTARERLAIKRMSVRGSGRGAEEWQVLLPAVLGIMSDVIVEGVIVLGRGDMVVHLLAGGEVV